MNLNLTVLNREDVKNEIKYMTGDPFLHFLTLSTFYTQISRIFSNSIFIINFLLKFELKTAIDLEF